MEYHIEVPTNENLAMNSVKSVQENTFEINLTIYVLFRNLKEKI